MNFVVDHDEKYCVVVGTERLVIIGWCATSIGKICPVVLFNGRPTLVDESRQQWKTYRVDTWP